MRRPSLGAEAEAGAIHLRKSLPLAAAIRWTPDDGHGDPAWDRYDVFITQDALRGVDRHVWTAPDRELLGFLLGDLYECPESGEVYVIVHAVVRTEHEIDEEAVEQIPEQVWRDTMTAVRTRRARVVGWYRSAPYVGQAPTAADVATHRSRFPEPWQVGLVVATSGPPAGAVFRVVEGAAGGGSAARGVAAAGAGTGAGAGAAGGEGSDSLGAAASLGVLGGSRGIFSPFLELLHKDALPEGDGPKSSVIDWENYVAGEPVRVVESVQKVRTAAAGRSATGATGAAGAGGAVPAAVARGTITGSPGILIPTGADHPVVPPSAPQRRRPIFPVIGYVLATIAVLVGAVMLARRVVPALEPDGGGARRVTAAHESGAGAVPGAPAGTGAQPGAPGLGATPGVAGGTPGAALQPSGASAAAIRRFSLAADSLSRAVTNYQARAEDFRLHRIACSQLATGYRLADEQFQTVASVYGEVRDSLLAPQHGRYQQIVDSVAVLNQQFDASGCPRP
ncbi:MAG TPA: hypothetical protein VFK13_08000 [Gemmatimonadaceae bacterium]|nr:hypothetical protein [Gemmatimonadaceae bacterium]